MPDNGEYRPEAGQKASRESYVNLVKESYEHSRDTFSPWLQRASRWYKLYRGYQQGKFVPNRSNITVPIAFGITQSDVSKKSTMLLGQQPYLRFIAIGPEDQRIARKRDALINLQLADADTFDKGTQFLTGAAIYGTMPYRVFWDTKAEVVNFRADLGMGEQAYSGEELTFDGPNWEPVSPFDFFPCPGYSRVRDMPWIVHRYRLEREDVNRLIKAGFYDAKAAGSLSDSALPADDITTTADDPASGGMENSGRKTAYSRPVEILEFWGRVPRSMAVGGQVDLVVTVANRQTLLRARPNPHNKIPFGAYSPMPDPRYFHGPSKVEVIEKLQIATNAFASQKADVLSLFSDPQFFYNRRGVVDPRRLNARPGKWHGFDGEVDDKQVRPVFPDLRALTNLYTELQQHSQWMQQGSGIIDDTVQGFNGADRETARSFVGRQEASGTRLLMEAKIAEAQWLEPLAMEFVRLNRSFLTFPRTLRMIGALAILDPWTLQPVPMETDSLNVNDMLPDYEARALGATRQMSQQGQLQALAMVGQMAAANPVGMQIMNWYVYFREVLAVAGIPNPDELLQSEPLIMGAMQNAMAMMNASQSLAGGPSQPGASQPATPAPASPAFPTPPAVPGMPMMPGPVVPGGIR